MLPTLIVFGTSVYPLGGKIAKNYNNRLLPMVFLTIGLISIFCSSFVSDFWVFFILFVIPYGIANGLTYLIPVSLAWKYFPNYKGTAGGIVIGGFGLGTFIFDFVATAIVNPENYKLENGVYPPIVGERVPFMI